MHKLGKLTKNTAYYNMQLHWKHAYWFNHLTMSNTKCFDNNGKNLVTL